MSLLRFKHLQNVGSAAYYRQWYYYIPMDEYQVVSISTDCKTKMKGLDAYKGYKFKLGGDGSVFFKEL